jgi:hypothetical protein
LTDVTVPRERDGRSSGAGGGVARDANASDGDATSREGDATSRELDANTRDGDAARELDANTRDRDAARELDADARDRDTATESNADARDTDDGSLAMDATIEGGLDGPMGEREDDASQEPLDACAVSCTSVAPHLLISEVVTRPSGAEMIEIVNPTQAPVMLSDYLISDSHLYYKVASGTFTTASGSDFAARFPNDAVILPGQYVVVALANASGGSSSFESTYGQKPDFELRPTANGATDDAAIPNMQPAQTGASIGATASLTDGGEPVILFYRRAGAVVADVDYLFFGVPTASNPAVDKTGVVVSEGAYAADTPEALQHPVPAPPDGGSLHRCTHVEPDERRLGGNGLTGHDETAENARASFVSASTASARTPGGPPPPGLCAP